MPKTFPSFVNGHVVTAEKRHEFSTKPWPIYLASVVHGKPAAPRKLATLPQPCPLVVSPTANYVLWTRAEFHRNFPTPYVLDIAKRTTKIIDVNEDCGQLLSWSLDGTTALYGNISADGTEHTYYNLFHLPTATFARVASDAKYQILAAFWSRDGKGLVFFAAPQNAPAQTKFLLAPVTIQAASITLGSPRAVSREYLPRLVGPALFSLLKRWPEFGVAKSKNGHPFIDTVGLSLSSDGKRGFVFGDDVHKNIPAWADANYITTYTFASNHTHKFLTPAFGITRVSTWCPGTNWIHCLATDGREWLWIDAATGKNVIIPFGKDFDNVIQVLP